MTLEASLGLRCLPSQESGAKVILESTLQSRHNFVSDCSHFVHKPLSLAKTPPVFILICDDCSSVRRESVVRPMNSSRLSQPTDPFLRRLFSGIESIEWGNASLRSVAESGRAGRHGGGLLPYRQSVGLEFSDDAQGYFPSQTSMYPGLAVDTKYCFSETSLRPSRNLRNS